MDEQEMFARLDRLGNGDRAALKREAGVMLSQANGRAIRIFYQCLPGGVPVWQEDRWFAAACFHCLWEPEEKGRQPLESIFYQMGRDDQMSGSLSHRLESLLDQSWEEDGYLLSKLSRLIKLVRARGIPVDCVSLLRDLLYWNGERQTVQRKWARALYLKPDDEDKEGE